MAALWSPLTAATAQAASDPVRVIVAPEEKPEAITRLIETLRKTGQPFVLQIGGVSQPAKQSSVPAAGERPISVRDTMVQSFRTGLATGLNGIATLPTLIDKFAQAWPTGSAGDQGATYAILVFIVVAVAVVAGLIARRLSKRLISRWRRSSGNQFIDRLSNAGLGLLADGIALVVFIAAGHILLSLGHPQPDLANAVADNVLNGLTGVALYLMGGRFLLSPDAPERRLLPIARPTWHFRMLMLYSVSVTLMLEAVSLIRLLPDTTLAAAGWFLLSHTIVTATLFWWFGHGAKDVVLLAASATVDGREPGLARRIAAVALPVAVIAMAMLIWVVARMGAATPEAGLWGGAAAFVQIALIIVPIVAAGVDTLIAGVAASRTESKALTPLAAAASNMARTIAVGAVFVLGLIALALPWSAYLDATAYPETAAGLRNLVKVLVAAVVGWAIWQFLLACFDAWLPKRQSLIPGDTDDAVAEVQGRLATVMPLIRNFVLGAVIAITVLLVLSALGVDITPLLAGAGVIGLAISFGSQALIRDIVSGVFFMAEDAFRVGEYIDTGKLKGTVEKIGMRSVQLRHQNGQVHTIPFGQLASTTNFSRDWATVKFNVRLDRSADIEKARKAIKKVGQELQADAELGPEFILPLKMQGVTEIADNALVVRLKFTAKPFHTSRLQRESLKRVYAALREAGVEFASNAVMVRSGSEASTAAAAVTQSRRERELSSVES